MDNSAESNNARSEEPEVKRVALITGNQLFDQFEPWYFGVAYAFTFKFCTGMPDMPVFSPKPRYRRTETAPRLEASEWIKATSRRAEAQLKRDWLLGFAQWNYLFRSTINLSRTFYSYETKKVGDRRGFTAEELENAAVSLCQALNGKYKDLDGRTRSVGGDMTKIRFAEGLSPAAIRILQNVEHTTRKIEGTQEVRRSMRHDTHANRIRYGVPIF